MKPADGSLPPRAVSSGANPQFTPDGGHLLVSRIGAGASDVNIWHVSLETGDSTAVLNTGADEYFPVPAPRGNYMVYVSDESGRPEVYLCQYPRPGGRWQVSSSGGDKALWSRSGRTLYYASSEDLYAVDVTLEPTVRLGTPRLLFRLGSMDMQTWGRWFFLPGPEEGQVLLLQRETLDTQTRRDMVAVENWKAEFRKKK
jgi:hypothetical protein